MEAGAVYRPAVEIEPASDGLIDQFTAVLVLPVTDALNCCVCDTDNVLVNGLMLTLTEFRAKMAELDLLGSTTLVAVTVTVCVVGINAGAVYSPAGLMEPKA